MRTLKQIWALRVLRAALAVVLGVAGIGKIFSPGGVMPRVLGGVLGDASYEHVLIGLGVLEILLALALLIPRAAVMAATACLFFFTGASVVVALSSADAHFLSNCGCFGALLMPEGAVEKILIRSVGLAAVSAVLLLVSRSRETRPRRAAWSGTAYGALLMIVALFISERVLHNEAKRGVQSALTGMRLAGTMGHDVGGLELTSFSTGRTSRAKDVLPAGGGLLLLSPNCPSCNESADHWRKLLRTHDAGNRTVLLVFFGERDGTEQFLQNHRLPVGRAFMVESMSTLHSIGVPDVPHLLWINAQGRVAYREGTQYRCRVMASIATLATSSARRVELWDELIGARLPDVRVDSIEFDDPARVSARIAIGAGVTPGRAVVAAVAPYGTWSAEVLVVVDDDFTLRHLEFLCAAPDYRAHAVDLTVLKRLVGLPLSAANEFIAKRLEVHEGYESVAWRIAREALGVAMQEIRSR